MTGPGLSKNFIFDEKIDSDYLFSLYADDYAYIEEVYAITLQHFDDDLDAIRIAWDSGEMGDLKRAAHKMKPAMGFIGLTAIQQQCLEFEELCQHAAPIDTITHAYKQLIATLADSKLLISSEYERLKAFNSNPLCP